MKMREAELREEIEREKAEQERREKISHYRKTGETVKKSEQSDKKTPDKVADQVGLGSRDTYYKAKRVWNKAKEGDGKAKELVKKLGFFERFRKD